MSLYNDERGYKRQSHSNLWHRKVAYNKIYKLAQKYFPEMYSLPFSKYEVHHIDGDKQNNASWNLAILTEDEHIDIHQEIDELRKKGLKKNDAFKKAYAEFIGKRKAELKRTSLSETEQITQCYLMQGLIANESAIKAMLNLKSDLIPEITPKITKLITVEVISEWSSGYKQMKKIANFTRIIGNKKIYTYLAMVGLIAILVYVYFFTGIVPGLLGLHPLEWIFFNILAVFILCFILLTYYRFKWQRM